MPSDPIAVTVKVTSVLEDLEIPYFIGGSLASTLYGMVRTTQDSDIVTEMRAEHIQHFVRALQGEFYMDEEMITDAIARQTSFNIIHRESMFKVDVFVPHERTFLRNQFMRAREEILSLDPEIRAKVASAEDVLLAKFEWYRMGGEVSERQWRDILGVLKIQADALDLDYLRQTAKQLKVDDLLERALNEA